MTTTKTRTKAVSKLERESSLPRLDIFEGLQKWGEVRLRSHHLDNTMYVELRRDRTEQWKPLIAFIAIDGKIMLRIMAESNNRVVCYDGITGTISDVASQSKLRDRVDLRNGEAGKDDDGSKKPPS